MPKFSQAANDFFKAGSSAASLPLALLPLAPGPAASCRCSASVGKDSTGGGLCGSLTSPFSGTLLKNANSS